jgi:hypothetical protein
LRESRVLLLLETPPDAILLLFSSTKSSQEGVELLLMSSAESSVDSSVGDESESPSADLLDRGPRDDADAAGRPGPRLPPTAPPVGRTLLITDPIPPALELELERRAEVRALLPE